jgi:hypothetical protein
MCFYLNFENKLKLRLEGDGSITFGLLTLFYPINFQLPTSNHKALQPCTACPQAKGHLLLFSISTSSFCNPLKLLYSDVWGPSPTLSLNDNRYYVSFIDAFTRFTWVYPMQSKYEVMSIFHKLQTMTERLLNTKIKSV